MKKGLRPQHPSQNVIHRDRWPVLALPCIARRSFAFVHAESLAPRARHTAPKIGFAKYIIAFCLTGRPVTLPNC